MRSDLIRFLKFVGWFLVAFVVIALLFDGFDLDTIWILAAPTQFVMVAVILLTMFVSVVWLGNLLFKKPDLSALRLVLNRATVVGLFAGAPIGYTPNLMFMGSGHTGTPGPGLFLALALLPAALISVVFGVIIALFSNYPWLGRFMIGGGVGVVAAVATLFVS